MFSAWSMSFDKRIVIDTSTLVSAVLRPVSVPRQAFVKAMGEADAYVSPATLAELEQVLSRDKFDRYLDREQRLGFIALYRRHARMCEITQEDEARLSPPCRDPRDNKFLALGMVCGAELIISSDDDLLTLNPYGRMRIMTPGDFLAHS